MYRLLTAIFLSAYIPWLNANDHEIKISAQTKQDLELVKSFENFSKQSSAGSIITVGGDPNGCDFNNIQDAIDSIPFAGSGLVHIANNKTYNENLVIGDINISLIGGYSDCTAAGTPLIQPSNTKISVDGSNASIPVLRIGGSLLRSSINLKNISLKNGSSTNSLLGAGLTAFDADTEIMLENLDISNNSGSGLAILGSGNGTTNTDMVMLNTVLSSNNVSLAGGGIYCVGDEASIVMGADSGLTFNQVTSSNGKGGGAFISNGCSFSMYSAAMVSNQAKDGGGGLFAGNGARINLIGRQVCDGNTCLGDDIRPIRFNANQGDSDSSDQGNGGAILITGESTFANMSQFWIDNNTAFHGGAISVQDGAQLYLQRFAKTCWNSHIDDKCNLFESNLASSSNGRGGAIYNDDGVLLLNQTHLENNRADFGTAVYANQSAATVIDGSILNHNGNDGINYQDQYVINASGGADFLIIHSTIADNHATNSVLGISSSSQMTVKNSIIHDSSTGKILNTNNPGISEFDCVMVHDIGTIDGFSIFVDNPRFKDRFDRNYHINASTSPAVDLCSSSSGADDIDTDLRGWDDPSVVNQDNDIDAIYDAGADETYANDIIFNNDFEIRIPK